MKLVHISWIDSHTDNDWKSLDEARREAAKSSALVMQSVGYVVADEHDYILLAGTWSPGSTSDDDTVNNTIQIPRGAVTELRSLENDDPDDSGAQDQRGASEYRLHGVLAQ